MIDEDATRVTGTMNYSTGVIASLRSVVDSETGENGGITRRVTSLEDMIFDINLQIATQEERITSRMDRMRAQFTSLDIKLAEMNSLSEYLAQNLPGNSNNKDD